MAACASDCEDELDSILLQASLQYETDARTDGSEKDRLACRTCLKDASQDDLDGDDDSLDGILLEASLEFEENYHGGTNETGNGQGKENVSGRFAIVSDADIEKDVSMSIPAKTRKQTNWCHNVWFSWRESQMKQSLEYPPVLVDMSDEELCKWVGKFLYEDAGKMVVNMAENLCTSCFVAFNDFLE